MKFFSMFNNTATERKYLQHTLFSEIIRQISPKNTQNTWLPAAQRKPTQTGNTDCQYCQFVLVFFVLSVPIH